MEITNTKTVVANLSPEFQPFINLRVGQKELKNIDKLTIKNECLKIITFAYNYSTPNGQTSSDVLVHQAYELQNCITGKFLVFTFLEIQQAFKTGLDGAYGTYFGLCGKTYTQFLNGFYSLPARGKAWAKFLEEIDKPKTTEVPLQMKADISKKGCLRVFQEYKETGKLTFFPHKYYDMLNELIGVEYKGFKTLVADPVKRKEILTAVKDKYEKDLLGTKKLYERKGRLSEAESIMLKITEGFKEDPILHNMQKKDLLTHYFDELIKNNKQLEI